MVTITFDSNSPAWSPDWDNVCYKVADGVLHMEVQQGLGDVWFIEITR